MGCFASKTTVAKVTERTLYTNESLYTSIRKRDIRPDGVDDGFTIGPVYRTIKDFCSYTTAENKKSGEVVTMKEINLRSANSSRGIERRKLIFHEGVNLTKLASNSAVPKLHEMFISESAVFIVLDLLNYPPLQSYVNLTRKEVTLTTPQVKSIISDIIKLIDDCHKQNICLRNLSPANFVLAPPSVNRMATTRVVPQPSSFITRIVDLSQASEFDDPSVLSSHPLFDWDTQLHFISPETANLLPSGPEADIWSLGILIFLLVSGTLPFGGQSVDRTTVCEAIKKGEYSFSSEWEKWPCAQSLIAAMLVTEPSQRLTIDLVAQHPWFTNPDTL